MVNQKGQSALEYLMTYGWALVVIVIVVAALFALGILNPATYQGNTCQGFSHFAYVDHTSNATTFEMILKNGTGAAATLVDMNLDAGGAYDDLTDGAADIDCTPDSATVAATKSVQMTCTLSSPQVSTGTYSQEVTLTYTARGLSHIETATCTGSIA